MTEHASGVPRVPAWRRYAARLVLLGGLAAVLAVVSPTIPREQRLVLRVPNGAAVKSLSVSWSRTGDAGATGGFTLKFPDGAPRSVEHVTSLANGPYDLEVTVERDVDNEGDSGRETKYHRRVRFEGDATIIDLRDEP
jgi:hypothetical protein